MGLIIKSCSTELKFPQFVFADKAAVFFKLYFTRLLKPAQSTRHSKCLILIVSETVVMLLWGCNTNGLR